MGKHRSEKRKRFRRELDDIVTEIRGIAPGDGRNDGTKAMAALQTQSLYNVINVRSGTHPWLALCTSKIMNPLNVVFFFKKKKQAD